MNTYTTKAQAIEEVIIPALGDYAPDFNIDAIFDEGFTYNENIGGYYQSVSDEELNEIVIKNDISC